MICVISCNDGFFIVGHGEVGALRRMGRHLDRAEQFLYLGFDLVYVDVAHYDNALQVGAVPFLVVIPQGLIREIVYHLHGSDGQAVGVFASREQGGECRFVHAHHRSQAGAPLFVDDTAFLVYFFRVEGKAVCPVVQDEQAGVDNPITGDGHVADVVHRFVYRGIGVQVGAELYADRL